MEQHDLIQGTPEWHNHRRTHFNASDAPAMMGCSPYKTRTQLLDEISTGIAPEVDESTQRRFDDGHRFEDLARPLAEKIIGKKLYRVTGSVGEISASFDGLSADDSIAFEHKSLNAELRECMEGQDEADRLPLLYRVQMEQQCMVSGCDLILFMASKWDENDELIEERHCWYRPDEQLRTQIIAGWGQFKKDLSTHQPKVIADRPQAQIAIELPTLFVHARGDITDSNMDAFGQALTAKLAEVRALKLETDQNFSDAKEAAKLFRDQAKKLKLAKEAMLAQTVTIGEASSMIDGWVDDLNKTALQLEKDVEREDLAKKRAMTNEAALEFTAHIEALESETRPIQLNVQRPNFADAIKSKRNYSSMHDAIQTMLSQAKSDADIIAKDVRDKLAWCKENAAGHSALFPDLQQIISKPIDDFTLTISSRIEKAKADEAAKLEAVRVKAEAEARANLEAEAKAKEAAALEEENSLIESIWKNARRIEGDSVQYVEKAIAAFESGAKGWETDQRPRVVLAFAGARKEMQEKLERAKAQAESVALANSEQLAAKQHAESQEDAKPAPTLGSTMHAAESTRISEVFTPANPTAAPVIGIDMGKSRDLNIANLVQVAPTRAGMVSVIAQHYGVGTALAEKWLSEAFAEVAA